MTEKFDPRKVFGQAVTEVAEQNKNVVVLSADSGKSSGFGDFMKKYPERYYECGIMEQGVVGIAAGMATVGMIPVDLLIQTSEQHTRVWMILQLCG